MIDVERRSGDDRREDPRVPEGGRRATDEVRPTTTDAMAQTELRLRRQRAIEAMIDDAGSRLISVYCKNPECRTPNGFRVKLCEVSAADELLLAPGQTVAIKCRRCNEMTYLRR